MPEYTEPLRTLFARAVECAKRRITYRALLGDGEGNLEVTRDDGTVEKDLVWARVTFDDEESARTIVAVRCGAQTRRYGLPVLLQRGIDGMLEVVGEDPTVIFEWAADGDQQTTSVAEHAWQHSRVGPDPIYLEGLQILPFSVQPTSPYSMSVDVWGGHYVYGGTQKFLSKTEVDLSSYVPAYGYKFVIVCLDPENNTVSVVEGTTKEFTTWPPPRDGDPRIAFDDSEVAAVPVSSPLLRLAAVQLQSNMTKVRPTDIFVDLRPVALSFGGSGGGGTVNVYSTTIGNGTDTTYTVTHNLGTRDVLVQIYQTSSPYTGVSAEISRTTVNSVTLSFGRVVSTDEFTVVIMG